MIVGRRRPRRFAPRVLDAHACRDVLRQGRGVALRLRIVRDLSEELDDNANAAAVGGLDAVNTSGVSVVYSYKDLIATASAVTASCSSGSSRSNSGAITREPSATWAERRNSNRHHHHSTNIPVSHQCMLFFWSAILFVVVRLPLRLYWDAGGLEEALQRCPAEVFTLPLWLFSRLVGNTRQGAPDNKNPNQQHSSDAAVYRIVPSDGTSASVGRRRVVYVGYRGIVFDRERIFLDRNTSVSSLDELMCWRRDLWYAAAAGMRSNGLHHHDDGERLTCVIAESGTGAFAFPRGTTRAGRHPRHHASSAPAPHAQPSADAHGQGQKNTIHVASLATVLQIHNGYYHWLTERLPALCLLRDVLQSNADTRILVDLRFHGAKEDNPWCMQFLNLLGIEASRVIPYDPCKVYSCDELFMTSPIPAYKTDPSLLDLVQRRILCQNKTRNSRNMHTAAKIWSRSHQKRTRAVRILIILRETSKVRRTAIWDGVHDILLREARQRHQYWDVLKLDPASMSVSAQIEAFSHADVVLGVHGAGLANALWCGRGARVCELVPINPPPIRYLFWHLSKSLRLEYHPYHVLSASWQDPWILQGADPEAIAAWVIASAIA